MNTPTIDYIFAVSELTSHFANELKKLCDKYDRDLDTEMLKACVILTDDDTLRILRGK